MQFFHLFLKFFKLGLSGWGGPVGRIALLQEELIEKERWVDEKKFGKVLAVYQMLPGPEATELACYFGHLKKGKLGSLIAGLGFMLPGFLLMLLLSYLYVSYGLKFKEVTAILYGIRPVVLALIFYATYKLAKANITDKKLLLIGLISFAIFIFTRIDFFLVLILAGIASYLFHNNNKDSFAGVFGLLLQLTPSTIQFFPLLTIFLFFLKTGLLTFGGAYSVVALTQQGAVYEYHWITNEQLLDGLALGSIVPAPLVIIATFVGYLAGGLSGALLATLGIFIPAFAFTLIGFNYIEKATADKKLQYFLAGITASVIGLIAATWVDLFSLAIVDLPTLLIAFFGLYLITRKFNFFIIIFASGLVGFLLKLFFL